MTDAAPRQTGADGSRDEGDAFVRALPIAILVIVGALLAVDVSLDVRESRDLAHVLVEGVAGLLALGGGVALWVQARAARRRARVLEHDLARTREEAERWRTESRDVMRGLAQALDRQFERWALTPAEREVALFLLNGMSLAAIGEARGASERTVREQARSVYRKAGLAGRAELAAFFLEDLLEGAASAAPSS